MRLAIFILLSSAIMVAAADQYQVQIVRPSTSLNIIDNCKEPMGVLKVDFQTLTLKSGVTYERRAVAGILANYLESTAVELGVDPDLVPCSKEAGINGHNTFMIRQGKCLASNVSVPEFCAGTEEEVVYSAPDLLSPDAGMPVSEISNLAVSLESELGKIKITVTFDEGSQLPDLYSYRLEFDGRTEVVASGSEIIVDELTSCLDLVFTLTPYIRDAEMWGSSAVYQLPKDEILSPVVSTNDDFVNIGAWQLTFNITAYVTDPCHTVVGYTVNLNDSLKSYPGQTLEFSANEEEIVLTCEQTNDFYELDLYVKTIDEVEAPEKFNMDPVFTDIFDKYFDKKLGLCLLTVYNVFYNSTEAACASYGGKQIGRALITEGFGQSHTLGWLSLDFNTSAQMWQWDDGTFLPNDDPLWKPGQGIPSDEWMKPYFGFNDGQIYLKDSRQRGFVVCYREEDL